MEVTIQKIRTSPKSSTVGALIWNSSDTEGGKPAVFISLTQRKKLI